MRRLPNPVEADQVMLPGRCRADLERLRSRFGVPFLRGPDELNDIPTYFGRARKASDMTKYDIQIFAEIVDASALSFDSILKRASDYIQRGANVIDLGGLPDVGLDQDVGLHHHVHLPCAVEGRSPVCVRASRNLHACGHCGNRRPARRSGWGWMHP